MKSRSSLIVLVVLVMGFGLLSFEISKGNQELEDRLGMFQREAVAAAGSSSAGRSDKGQRAETVGDLLNRTPVPVDARGMLKMIALLQQDLRLVPAYQLGVYLERLSSAELRALRRDLRLTPGLEMHREFLENMISVAELRLDPEDLGGFFLGGS